MIEFCRQNRFAIVSMAGSRHSYRVLKGLDKIRPYLPLSKRASGQQAVSNPAHTLDPTWEAPSQAPYSSCPASTHLGSDDLFGRGDPLLLPPGDPPQHGPPHDRVAAAGQPKDAHQHLHLDAGAQHIRHQLLKLCILQEWTETLTLQTLGSVDISEVCPWGMLLAMSNVHGEARAGAYGGQASMQGP